MYKLFIIVDSTCCSHVCCTSHIVNVRLHKVEDEVKDGLAEGTV